MKRLVTVLAFSFVASGAALACGDGKCDKAHCDMPASTASTTQAAPLPADGKHVKLAIAGMHCGSCADKVKTALVGVEGVKGATVDFATGVAEVSYDEKKTNTDKLIAAVTATKFTATVKTN